MRIGIDEHTGLVYEASNTLFFPVWPSPILLQALIHSSSKKELTAPASGRFTPLSFLFREDGYDAANRVRRGRLYQAGNAQPQRCLVNPHPAIAEEKGISAPRNKELYGFNSLYIRGFLDREKIEDPLIVLGAEKDFTVWSLVSIERTASDDELIFLRARQSMGALPHVDRKKILEARGNSVISYLEKLENDIYKAGPESVVDRAREAAVAILSKYYQNKGMAKSGEDLGKLATIAEKDDKAIVANSARIIARLHARGKHAEQETREIRPIREQDGQFAVQAVGTILCDLEWGSW